MGLSSSQGRLLMLTSRLSDIELAQIMISQRQNQLAWESEAAAKEYNEAVSNYKLTIKVPDTSGDKSYTKEDLSFQNMYELGYRIVDSKGNVYLPPGYNNEVENSDEENSGDENSTGTTPKEDNFGNDTRQYGNETYVVSDATQFMNNPKLLQDMIMNGLLFVYNTNDEDATSALSLSLLEAETEIEYVLDTSDDAQAQSKYDYETARISRQDNSLDMDMQQLETQHEAVSKEYDSVKEVIQSNVERTFKLFSNG